MAETWDWKLLRAGSFRLDGGAMFGIIPKVLWQRTTSCDDQNRITLQTNCLLLDNGERKVLVETGYGNKADDKMREQFAMEDRSIIEALGEEGIDAGEIDDVVVTHLHFDHAGGLTQLIPGKGPKSIDRIVPTFPNARIHVQRREWDDALANRSTMTRTYFKEHLAPIKNALGLYNGDAEPIAGIWLSPAPGHTWGQQAVFFRDAQGVVVFPGDVMPTAQHAGLAFNMAYDVEPFTNMQTKAKLLERCVDEGWRWVLDHEPSADAVMTVARHPERRDSRGPRRSQDPR